MGKIIAFSGSNSSVSINQKLIESSAALFEKHEVEVLNLRDYTAPLFSADLLGSGVPDSMKELNEGIQ